MLDNLLESYKKAKAETEGATPMLDKLIAACEYLNNWRKQAAKLVGKVGTVTANADDVRRLYQLAELEHDIDDDAVKVTMSTDDYRALVEQAVDNPGVVELLMTEAD